MKTDMGESCLHFYYVLTSKENHGRVIRIIIILLISVKWSFIWTIMMNNNKKMWARDTMNIQHTVNYLFALDYLDSPAKAQWIFDAIYMYTAYIIITMTIDFLCND